MQSSEQPLLSVIVALVSDTTRTTCDSTHLAACLEALANQENPPPLEVIVPVPPHVQGIDEVKRRFPQVCFLPIERLQSFTGQGGSREHHDELRARGLAVARGAIVALLEDHGLPDAHWATGIAKAHQEPFAGIGGAIENGVPRLLNWAVYFCDFGKYQNPVPAGESEFASDANIAYKRQALEAIRPVWEEVFSETAVNWTLRSRGEKLALSPAIVVYQHRTDLRFLGALRERFIWGRSYAASRGKLVGTGKRLLYGLLAPLLPAVLIARMAKNVLRKRRRVLTFLAALPFTALLTVGWSLGEWVGYWTARAHGASASEAMKPTAVTAQLP